MYKKLFVTIIIASMTLSTSAFNKQSLNLTAFFSAASPQEKGRSVEKSWRKLAPLKIRTIKAKRGEILLGKTFVDNDDEWFQGLSVVLENISGKTITYIGAGLLFPRQVGDVGKAPPYYKSLFYGLHPDAPPAAINRQPLALKPGEKITLTLFDTDYYELKNDLRKFDYSYSIKTIKFHLEEVYFDDGTSWVAGTWFPRNGNKTRRSAQEQPPLSSIPKSPSSFLSHGFQENKPDNFFLSFKHRLAGNLCSPVGGPTWKSRGVWNK